MIVQSKVSEVKTMIRREKRIEEIEKTIYIMNRQVKYFLELVGVMVGMPLILISMATKIPNYLQVIGCIAFGVGFLATLTEGE